MILSLELLDVFSVLYKRQICIFSFSSDIESKISILCQELTHPFFSNICSRSKINHDPYLSNPGVHTSEKEEKTMQIDIRKTSIQPKLWVISKLFLWVEKIRYLGLTNFTGFHRIMLHSYHYKYVMCCASMSTTVLSTIYSWLHLITTITWWAHMCPFYRGRGILGLERIRVEAKISSQVCLTQMPKALNHEAFLECIS